MFIKGLTEENSINVDSKNVGMSCESVLNSGIMLPLIVVTPVLKQPSTADMA